MTSGADRRKFPSPAAFGVMLAMFLMGASIVGTPLYVASAASAAATDQLAHACPSESGLTLVVPTGVATSEVMQIGDDVPHVDPPLVTQQSPVRVQAGSPVPKTMFLLTRDGATDEVHPPVEALGRNEVAVSRDVLVSLGAQVGDRIEAQGDDGTTVYLVIAQTFDNLPFRPEPVFWCGFSQLLRPNRSGDAGPPWGLVSTSTQEAFGAGSVRWLEYSPTRAPLSMRDAREMEDAFEAAQQAYTGAFRGPEIASSLPELLERASGLATGVERSVTPTGLAGQVAATITLIAAATFLAKEREQELTLFAIRGQLPSRTAIGLVPSSAVPMVIGAVAGGVAGIIGVRALGPSPRIEVADLVGPSVGLALACAIALAVVVVRVALLGDRLVDSDGSGRGLRRVPLELALVPVGAVSFVRLSDGHASQMIGVRPQGGELLAQAFPLLGLVALAAAAHRPLRFVVGQLRVAGGRLPRSFRLGVRRAVVDARAAAILVVVFALAAGCFTTARVLVQTSKQALADKAHNFVGADLVVDVYGAAPPMRPGVDATEVNRIKGHLDGATVEILGVDRSTFAGVARLRGDAASVSLGELLDRIAPGPSAVLPAIVVGDPSLHGTVQIGSTIGRPDIVVDAVAHADFFPGSSSGVMVVVDRDALVAQADFGQHSIWFDDPPPDVVENLRSDGARIGLVSRAASVFDTTNYRAQAWSYAPLEALGIMFLVIALGVQLLVVSARRTARQQADVIMRRSGFRTAALWRASVVEALIPTAIGAIAGIASAIGVALISIDHLDTLPGVAPPPRLIVSSATVLLPVAVMIPMVVVVAGIIVRSTRHSDQMRAIRGFATDV
ncbi:MAG: ABC transporter permease [Actinobacteria bacterium]|nr:ABC transporter permease [Actinomycetota bacterium]